LRLRREAAAATSHQSRREHARWNENERDGTVDQAKGRVKQAVGTVKAAVGGAQKKVGAAS
jgi:hypothetical protein